MKFASSALAAFLLVAMSPMVHSFAPSSNTIHSMRVADTQSASLFLSPQDLTDYMAKAHEEKIKAIKEVEEAKNKVIEALKDEVEELKSIPKESAVVMASPPPSTANVDLSELTIEELRAKLLAYQQFMATYIVEAHEQKRKAVEAAEVATAAKYEGKLKLLLGEASKDSAAAAPPAVVASADTKLYDTRSASVAAAAKAGKSRWGDAEVAKVQISSDAPAVVDATDVNGAAAKGAVPAPVSLPGSSIYEGRNERVVAAAKAGKSRWGDAEVKRAAEAAKPALSSSSSTPAPAPAAPAPVVVESTPEIEAADHGLRSDGGVGGPSLAERVNLGQQLFAASSSAAVAVSAPAPANAAVVVTNASAPVSIYDLRNAKLVAAAAAGKSRWGSMENTKAASLAASKAIGSSSSATATLAAPAVVTTPEIEAADHGLRNDGGVGGPSLAERVNLGSGLF